METVTVTSRGWGGQGWMPAPGASQTANATVQIRGAGPPGCGDERDTIIQEYINFGISPVPRCGWFNHGSARSVHFSNGEMTVNEPYTWSLIREPLTGSAGSGYGLDRWVDLYMAAHPGAPARTINSGYRSPVHNQSVGGAPGSRHLFGDAVDLKNETRTTQEYTDLRNAAKDGNPSAGASWVEDWSGPCGNGCVHADWRDKNPGVYSQ